jgi:hypothetical protein
MYKHAVQCGIVKKILQGMSSFAIKKDPFGKICKYTNPFEKNLRKNIRTGYSEILKKHLSFSTDSSIEFSITPFL